MEKSLKKWRLTVVIIGWSSLVLLLLPTFLFGILLFFSIKSTIATFNVDADPSLQLDMGSGHLMPCGACIALNNLALIWTWVATGLVGLWTLPQLNGAIRLVGAMSSLNDGEMKESKRLIKKWLHTQLFYVPFEVFGIGWFVREYLHTSKTAELRGYFYTTDAIFGLITFSIVCLTLRLVCLSLVGLFHNKLSKFEWQMDMDSRKNYFDNI